METSLKFMKLLTESGVSEESMTNAFRKAANVNPDKQNSEIINALKNENKKLKQQLAKRNVAGSRKVIDFKGDQYQSLHNYVWFKKCYQNSNV